jgi:tRNA(His) 5'-end guanylyltransferase
MVRIDGKKFSNLTKKLKLLKPYDEKFSSWMAKTTMKVASEMQGCVIGYTQSDEITFVIRSDQTDETTPWFDNRVQKIVSVASSVASAVFNSFIPFRCYGGEYVLDAYGNKEKIALAFFDCRVWPMPNMTEVVNNLIWRQNDCTKNSISSACYYEVSRHKDEDGNRIGKKTTRRLMHKLNQKEQQDLLFQKTGINWNSFQPEFKRGIVAFRESITVETENGRAERKKWTYQAAPVFTSENGRSWLNIILS